MKKWVRRGAIVLLVILGIAFGGFYIWSSFTYSPSDLMNQQVERNSYVREEENWYRFGSKSAEIGYILYPGAKVEPESYAYYAQQLVQSNKDVTVIVPSVRFNIALLDRNRAIEIIERYPDVDKWIVGGHSLGGVAASDVVGRSSHIEGLILFASYPMEGSNLRDEELPVLSVWATEDGLTTKDEIDISRDLLPAHTEFVSIQGGNHAQFGMYGEQRGDGTATIDVLQQQQILIEETNELIETVRD
ncbi:hypothetical protein N781_01070 [Pontibacillus halophilus JSM 076056 = DSM 19796]|uniref:Alpha/beta hydrolase fold-5 domain-containing protein n=1 Tax=Pontibacillus halophilus JSM 076056 = DSM 19796 TaxID=1385510 RepID=A0A0A5GKK6_9BACI|nr:alpha/beta hydrolase [Pontibacillus halophilus]KGX93821.1 hypothetical protein N781_01070 [Pontibacillus halophilus JSM 076056 = DSM 19796]